MRVHIQTGGQCEDRSADGLDKKETGEGVDGDSRVSTGSEACYLLLYVKEEKGEFGDAFYW